MHSELVKENLLVIHRPLLTPALSEVPCTSTVMVTPCISSRRAGESEGCGQPLSITVVEQSTEAFDKTWVVDRCRQEVSLRKQLHGERKGGLTAEYG